MAVLSPLDAMFLMMEAREKPAHVGGMQLFQPPEGADPNFLSQLYEQAIASTNEVRPLFIKRPHRPGGIGPWTWQDDEKFDLEYHVRHSALPQPGRVRELLALVSRLHGSLLDRNRPLWEAHLIEGLHDGRFALYTKVHHALVDGVSAMRLLITSLSTDPNDRDMPFPWERRPSASRPSPGPVGIGDRIEALARSATEVPGLVAGASMAALRQVIAGITEQAAATPYQAPRTMLNVPVTGARRFAAQSWEMERIRMVGKRFGATVNDMVLAMSSGALRRYLLDHDALPEQPLIAMVPVSLKAKLGEDQEGGNAVGALLCNLATHLDDPVERLAAIQASMSRGKAQFEGLTPIQILALSALALSPGALSIGLGRIEPIGSVLRPGFNVVISNVPGSRDPLYWNGARMVGSYPVSVLVDGQAMNITVTSYADSLDFGILGCRRNVPSLQRMLVHLEDELAALEAAS
jgi:diacylglycerol O-acyltransferase / wax synthase